MFADQINDQQLSTIPLDVIGLVCFKLTQSGSDKLASLLSK